MTLLTTSLLDTKAYDFSVLRHIFESQIVQSGVVNKGDYLVTAKASQPPMGVSVAAGAAWVKATTGTRNGAYHVVNDGSVDITLTAANATNPRVDRIILRVADTSDLASATDTATLEVLSGTPTSGATLVNLTGAAAQPANTLNLAFVLVGAGVTSVVGANIGNWLDPIGTAAGSPVVSGAVTTAAPAFALGRAANTTPYLVSTLPASPFDGQEVYYRADNTNGVIWHLRARSVANGGNATYPWEFVGGGTLISSVQGDNFASTISASTWTAINAGTDPSITAPLAGEYVAEHTASLYIGAGTFPGFVGLGIKVGATEPITSGDATNTANIAHLYASTAPSATLVNRRLITLTKATPGTTDIALARYFFGITSAGSVRSRSASLTITPVRVG